MKVSVVMPVYNKAAFLKEAVESILSGTFSDLELIAVDDKSTDESLSILHAMTDPRLRIIELSVNQGPAGAANAGLDAARGEYIVRMDADDVAVPDRLALQVAFMDRHPEVGASGGQLQLFGGEVGSWNFPLSPEACSAQLLFGVPISQGASILRRTVVERHGLRYDPTWPRVGEDWLFWVRMAQYTQFANISDVLIHYRRGIQNIAHGRDRSSDYTVLQSEVFHMLGIPFTEEELDLHLMGLRIFKMTPSPRRVRALRRWYDRLLEVNAAKGFAPRQAFVERVHQQWAGLFHYLPRYGALVALEHLRLSAHFPLALLVYIGKYRINALRGMLPNG